MNQSDADMMLPFNWFWSEIVPANVLECLDSDIEKLSNNKVKGSVGIPGVTKEDTVIRNSDILMLDPLHWFSGIMFNVTLASNAFSGWNFNVSTPEATQIAFYGIDQHYTWHFDAFTEYTTWERKISSATLVPGTVFADTSTTEVLGEPVDFDLVGVEKETAFGVPPVEVVGL